MPFKHKCERKLTGEHNHCSNCGQYFNSNHAFDKHRIGVIGIDRRCATINEMQARGMSISKTGWWITATMPDELAQELNPN
jgi:hypothetical protein